MCVSPQAGFQMGNIRRTSFKPLVMPWINLKKIGRIPIFHKYRLWIVAKPYRRSRYWSMKLAHFLKQRINEPDGIQPGISLNPNVVRKPSPNRISLSLCLSVLLRLMAAIVRDRNLWPWMVDFSLSTAAPPPQPQPNSVSYQSRDPFCQTGFGLKDCSVW